MLNRKQSLTEIALNRTSGIRVLLLVALVVGGGSGCQKMLKTDDPALKPIQEMLEKSVPPGTPRANVSQYLSSQGYAEERSDKPGTVVTVIRKIDIEKMQPVTARATFYFDANGRLNTFELQRVPNQPIR